MEKMLHLLETFTARGSDGNEYAVRGYEHLVRLAEDERGAWEPAGVAEYKLADGRHVRVDADGTMSVPALDVTLERRRGERSAGVVDAGGDGSQEL